MPTYLDCKFLEHFVNFYHLIPCNQALLNFFFPLKSQKTFRRNTVAAEIGGELSTFSLNYFKVFFIDGKQLYFEMPCF